MCVTYSRRNLRYLVASVQGLSENNAFCFGIKEYNRWRIKIDHTSFGSVENHLGVWWGGGSNVRVFPLA